jgi:hypothetical protein
MHDIKPLTIDHIETVKRLPNLEKASQSYLDFLDDELLLKIVHLRKNGWTLKVNLKDL